MKTKNMCKERGYHYWRPMENRTEVWKQEDFNKMSLKIECRDCDYQWFGKGRWKK